MVHCTSLVESERPCTDRSVYPLSKIIGIRAFVSCCCELKSIQFNKLSDPMCDIQDPSTGCLRPNNANILSWRLDGDGSIVIHFLLEMIRNTTHMSELWPGYYKSFCTRVSDRQKEIEELRRLDQSGYVSAAVIYHRTTMFKGKRIYRV